MRIEEVDVNSEIVVCSYDEEHDRLSNLSDDLIFNIRIEEADENSETVVCSYDEEHDRLSNLSDDLIFNIRIEEADENSEAVVCSYDEEHDRLSNLSDDLIFHIRIEEVDENYETVVCSCDEEHDRLSNLSDDLIFHILSFLSTKESYRTCVLSTRWGSICTKIPDLHFELPEIPDQSVYAALLRRTENIRKLSLDSVVACQPQDVHMWVSKALDLMVQELDLELLLHGKTLLPLRLFRCESLVVLKLRGRICPGFSSSFDVYLPSLKILHLRLIVLLTMFDDHVEYDLDKFLSGCPHEDIFQQPINISLLLLKRLTLYLFMPIVASHIGPVQINAPSLEVLSITDYSSSPIIYEVVNLSNLDEATLFIDQLPDFYSLYTLMKGLSNVKSLTLGSKTFHILSMEDKLEKIHLLTFHNLLSLSVEISENISWSMLVCFLHNTPKLKDLAIEKEIEKNSQRKEVGNSSWVGPSVTPTCLSISLIAFEFKGIQNIKTELDFALYIINHSRKLEKVKIFTPDSEKVVERCLLKGSEKSSVLVLV